MGETITKTYIGDDLISYKKYEFAYKSLSDIADNISKRFKDENSVEATICEMMVRDRANSIMKKMMELGTIVNE